MFADENSRTEINELGEFGLIRHLTEKIRFKNESSIIGVGDDAAVIDNRDTHTVLTTDMLIEGVHFDLSYCPLKHLGYKAVIVNLSDIYAMNATPRQITMNIGISNRFSLEALEEFYSGVYLACERYGVDLIGGDTTSSMVGFVISVTAIGQAEKEDIVYRSGAKENDLICVSGDLGAAYMGLQVLKREKEIFKENPQVQPDLAGNDYILERQLKPEARQDIIKLFEDLKIRPTSLIDISDGLSSDLIHICTHSKKGCSIYDDKLPIDTVTNNVALEFNLDPSICALNGGEDYELLFTIDLNDHEKIRNEPQITVIGHITDESDGMELITRDGKSHPLTAQGWDALMKKEENSQQ